MWYPFNSLVEKFLDSKWFKFVLYFEFELRKRRTTREMQIMLVQGGHISGAVVTTTAT
jgi:hypothetical protein